MGAPPSTSAAPLPVMPAGLSGSARRELRRLALALLERSLTSSATPLAVATIARRMTVIIGEEARAQTYFCAVVRKPVTAFHRYRIIGKMVDQKFLH